MQRLETDFHFFVPVDVVKSADLGKEGDWVFEGLASTSNIDLFGDVVYPESFQNSIEFFKKNGKIFYNHNYARSMPSEMMEAQTPIGVPIDAYLKEDGLYIKAVLNKEHPIAKKIWRENLSNPDTRFSSIGLSIGAKALGKVERKYSDVHKKYVSVLPDLLLYEVSMTATPVNPDTKTWISNNSLNNVIKSLMDDDSQNTSEEFVEVEPDEVVYDKKNNIIVVKSTVQGEDGIAYILQHKIDVTEDIKKAMPEDTDKKPQEGAFPPKGDEKKTAPDLAGAETAPEGGADQGAPAEGGAPEGMPGDDAGMPGAEGGAPGAEGGESGAEGGMPGAEGGMPGEGGDAGAGSPLDSLFGGGAEGGEPGEMGAEGGEPGAEAPQEDSSMSLIMDKLDTLVEVMTTVAQDFAASKQSENPGIDSSDQPPSLMNDDILKSMDDVKVELSKINSDNLATIIKSVLADELKNIVKEVVDSVNLQIKPDVVKSVDVEPKTIVIRQPGVELATVLNEDGTKTVIKSTDGQDLDIDILKSFISDYVSIKGSGGDKSAKRASIITNATKTLGIQPYEFSFQVRRFEKGEL